MGRGGRSECTAYVELDSLLGLGCGRALPNVPSAVSLYLAIFSHFLINFCGFNDQWTSFVGPAPLLNHFGRRGQPTSGINMVFCLAQPPCQDLRLSTIFLCDL